MTTFSEIMASSDFLKDSPELKIALHEVTQIADACTTWIAERSGVDGVHPHEVIQLTELVLQRANLVAFAEEERQSGE